MCTLIKNLEIRPATRAAYDALAQFHYRAACPAVCAAIYAIYNVGSMAGRERSDRGHDDIPIGVIVYTMPAMELQIRNTVIADMFKTCHNRSQRIKMINENIRCISRVIIDPRYRGLGLASRLVRETMPLMYVPIIEAIAAMGRVNPFFEKAGMTAYPAKMPRHCQKLLETLKLCGIDEHLFIQPAKVQKKLDALCGRLKFWLEHEIQRFLQAYGKRRTMLPGLDRTRFILSKLTTPPIYYIWFKNCL
jgi:GNAT superfamily N-acetyltransferase